MCECVFGYVCMHVCLSVCVCPQFLTVCPNCPWIPSSHLSLLGLTVGLSTTPNSASDLLHFLPFFSDQSPFLKQVWIVRHWEALGFWLTAPPEGFWHPPLVKSHVLTFLFPYLYVKINRQLMSLRGRMMYSAPSSLFTAPGVLGRWWTLRKMHFNFHIAWWFFFNCKNVFR